MNSFKEGQVPVPMTLQRLEAMGVGSLPFPSEDIVFVKTTMAEEGYSAAYTHKTEIYVGEKLLKLATRCSIV